jgi:4-phytase/acid phosphatase/peptide/nickel transport system substrate-binding protein
VTKAFTRDFDLTPWRIIDLAGSGCADVREFPHRQPGQPVELFRSRARQDAGGRAGHRRPGQAHRLYCKIADRINEHVQWFWSLGKPVLLHRQAGLERHPKQRSDEIDLAAAWWDKKK